MRKSGSNTWSLLNPCRFLTSVELTPEPRTSRLKGHHRYSFKGKDHPHHQVSQGLGSFGKSTDYFAETWET